MATLRLINSGVLEGHPGLTIQMAHLSGGIASLLGRARMYKDKEFWATTEHPRDGLRPERDLVYYLRERVVFDTAGFRGDIRPLQCALIELPASRLVFATDYPHELRTSESVGDFVKNIRALGKVGRQILSGNVERLLSNWKDQPVSKITSP
jgi:predicted TIM-barrel fold metal-dependent hydrolase